MSNDTLALLISAVSLAGTGFNAWLKLQIRSDIQQLEKDILREVDTKFVRKGESDLEMEALERRVQLLESARWK